MTEISDEKFQDMLENGVFPHPICLKSTTDIGNDIQGIIAKENGNLVKNYFSYNKLGHFLVDGYNDWVMNRLKVQLDSLRVRFSDGSEIYYTNPICSEPKMNDRMGSTSAPEIMLPQTARNLNMTYEMDVKAMPVFRNSKGVTENLKKERVSIGKIPVMLSSCKCNLRGMSDDQLRSVGEDPSSCLGYFIVEGVEYVIIIREKMRANKMILFKHKKFVTCRITLMTPIKNSIVSVVLMDDLLKFFLPSLLPFDAENDKYAKKLDKKQQHFNVFHLFKIVPMFYGDKPYEDYNEILEDFILPFVKKDRHNRVIIELSKTIYDMQSKENIDTLFMFENLLKGGISGESRTGPRMEAEVLSRMKKYINRDFFPNLNNIDYRYKFLNLGLMIAHLAEYMAGYRTLDDQDSWVNKKLDTAGTMMEQLFKIKWEQMLNFELEKEKMKENNNKRRTTEVTRKGKREEGYNSKYFNRGNVTLTMAENYIKSINADDLTTCFRNAFSKKWAVKGKYTRDNIVQRLKRDNLTSALSHILRVDIESIHRETSQSVRAIQPTQFGFICPVHSPEGGPCGLVKNMAVTCSVTINSENDEAVLIERYTNLVLNIDGEYVKDKDKYTDVFFYPYKEYCNYFAINSKVYGFCKGRELYEEIYELKISGKISNKTSVCIDKDDNINIYCDGSRLVKPLLVVVENKPDKDKPAIGADLKLDLLKMRGRPFNELLEKGVVVYVDPEEQNSIKLASNIQDIKIFYEERDDITKKYEQTKLIYEDASVNPNISAEKLELMKSELKRVEMEKNRIFRRMPYTHCQLHPEALLSVSASLIPFIHYNQSARAAFQAGMATQALAIHHSNHVNRFEGKTKQLAFPSMPIARSNMEEVFGLDRAPQGENAIVLFYPYKGMNAEDALVMNKRSVDLGKFRTMKYSSHTYLLKKETKYEERLVRPNDLKDREKELYEAIEENGLPSINADVKSGQMVISVIRINRENPSEPPFKTGVALGKFEDGVVDRIHISKKNNEDLLVKVKLRSFHAPKQGDKFAVRNAQKATLSVIVPPEDLPYTADGVTPDIIINPHCIPGRMTMSYLIEVLTGKSMSLMGQPVSASPYEKIDLDIFFNILESYGFNRNGKEVMYSGLTGEKIKRPMFIGPVYFQVLRHQVDDKYHARGHGGGVNAKTRQPTRGRSKDGGLRFGEMERDVLIAHGSAMFLKDRLCDASDAYKIAFCRQCGSIAITDVILEKNICKTCDPHGKKGNEGYFRQTIPFAFKNYMNLLTPLGIKLTFNTKYNKIMESKVRPRQAGKMKEEKEIAEEDGEYEPMYDDEDFSGGEEGEENVPYTKEELEDIGAHEEGQPGEFEEESEGESGSDYESEYEDEEGEDYGDAGNEEDYY